MCLFDAYRLKESSCHNGHYIPVSSGHRLDTQHLETSTGHHYPSPAAAGKQAWLVKWLVPNDRLCDARVIGHILRVNECIVQFAPQYRSSCASYHPEVAQRVLVVVLVVRAALTAYQHTAAAAGCPQVLRVSRPRGACEVAALLDEFASTARNAAGVPGPRVVSDVLGPAAVAIRTVGVLVGERAAVRRLGMPLSRAIMTTAQ